MLASSCKVRLSWPSSPTLATIRSRKTLRTLDEGAAGAALSSHRLSREELDARLRALLGVPAKSSWGRGRWFILKISFAGRC